VCVAVCCSVLKGVPVRMQSGRTVVVVLAAKCLRGLQCVATCCSVLQCVAVRMTPGKTVVVAVAAEYSPPNFPMSVDAAVAVAVAVVAAVSMCLCV